MLEVRHKMVDFACDAMLIHHAKLSNVQIEIINCGVQLAIALVLFSRNIMP